MATIINSASPEQSALPGDRQQTSSQAKDSFAGYRLDSHSALEDVRRLNASATTKAAVDLPAFGVAGTEPGQDIKTVIKTPKAGESGTKSMFSTILGDVENVASTASKVGKQLWNGAADEVIHHPGTLLKDAAIGAITGAAMTFLPALAVPALVIAGYELIKNRHEIVNAGKEFANDVSILNDGSIRSAAEIEKADESLMGFGRTGAEVAAGIAGGAVGSMAMRAAIAARAASTSVQAVQSERNALGVASQRGADHIQYTDNGLVDEKGIFSNFKFQPIDHSRVLDFKDTWQLDGSRAEVEADLQKAGFQKWGAGFHFGDEEWRLPADARGSVHFNIANSVKDVVTGAWKTIGNVHGFEYDPGTHMVSHFLHDVVRI